jgi:hypothetical protein
MLAGRERRRGGTESQQQKNSEFEAPDGFAPVALRIGGEIHVLRCRATTRPLGGKTRGE